MAEYRGVVLHIAEGYYEGTISWQHNAGADVSSHFIVAGPRDVAKGTAADGAIAQVVDTAVAAWTQRAGNGHWVSVECSGFSGDALSPAQIEACARILAKGHQVYGYPLQLATSPAGKGLGHHSMGTNGRSVPTDTWTGATWGHEQCPGPKIVAQKPAILARALSIIQGDDDMTPAQAAELHELHEIVRWNTNPWAGDTLNTVKRIETKVDAALTAIGAIGSSNPDVAAILAGVDQRLSALKAEVRDAVADLGEGGADKVRAGTPS
jgi:hypothetical protein